jgi:hypothetical protein
VYQHIQNLPDSEAQKALKTYPVVLKDLKRFVRSYSLDQTEGVMEVLQEYDLKFKGLGTVGNSESMLTEMVFKIIHPDHSVRNYGATG